MLNKFNFGIIFKFLFSFFKKYFVFHLFAFFGLVLTIVLLFPIFGTPFYMHIDEPASYVVTTPSNSLNTVKKINYRTLNYEKGIEYKTTDLYKLLFVTNNNPSNVIKDLCAIRLQTLDRSHASLYYTVLRIWNICIPNDIPLYMLLYSRFLNLIFYTISFFFMYKLLKLFFKKKEDVYLGLIFAFGTTATVSLVTMAREYTLQSSLYIIVTYIYCLMYKKIENPDYKLSEILSYGVGIALFLLSGYWSLIYAGMLSVVLFFLALKKNKHSFIFFTAIFITVLAVVFISCPNYLNALIHNEQSDWFYAVYKTRLSSEAIKFSLSECCRYLQNYLFYTIPILLSFAVFLIKLCIQIKNKAIKEFFSKENLCCISFIAISFIWIFFVMILTPFKCSRFILPAMPVLSITYLLLLSGEKLWLKLSVVLIIFSITYNNLLQEKYFDYLGDRRGVIVEKKIDTSLPVITDNNSYFYTIPFLFLNSGKNGVLIFVNELPALNYKYKKYYLMTTKELPYYYRSRLIDTCGEQKTYLIDNTD